MRWFGGQACRFGAAYHGALLRVILVAAASPGWSRGFLIVLPGMGSVLLLIGDYFLVSGLVIADKSCVSAHVVPELVESIGPSAIFLFQS